MDGNDPTTDNNAPSQGNSPQRGQGPPPTPGLQAASTFSSVKTTSSVNTIAGDTHSEAPEPSEIDPLVVPKRQVANVGMSLFPDEEERAAQESARNSAFGQGAGDVDSSPMKANSSSGSQIPSTAASAGSGGNDNAASGRRDEPTSSSSARSLGGDAPSGSGGVAPGSSDAGDNEAGGH